jgi:ADP-ribosyl-[dinitrogen reductase] hydrolase
VRASLAAFERTDNPFSGSTSETSAGNGSLMRLAPVPLYFAADPELAVRMAGESSRTTHGARAAVDACRYFAGLLIGALAGMPKHVILGRMYSPVPEFWRRERLNPAVAVVASGSFHMKAPPAIRGSGYVVDCLEAALWAFSTTEDFRSGALAAVNLGDDADTTGAVYGQIAGAYYGVEGIPARWREVVTLSSEVSLIAGRLADQA